MRLDLPHEEACFVVQLLPSVWMDGWIGGKGMKVMIKYHE